MGLADRIREISAEGGILEKLEGLRSALIRIFLVVAVLSTLSFFLWREVLHFLHKPLGLPLIMYSLPEAFLTSLRVSLFLGIFLAAPFIFHGLWIALGPLLSLPPGWGSWAVVLGAAALFYGGAFFCYFFVLPVAINFLVHYGSENLKPMIGLSKYLSFSIGLILAFGVVFELPLILLILGRVGLVNYSFLARNRRYALLINSILSALITPTPDAYTMLLMMIPIQALYEISIWLVKIFGKPRMIEAEPS
jgi:sec-independent protein translocase protein TatC